MTESGKVPFFTVIITTFNRRNVVGKAIDSVLEQRFKDWECIIVDDGSTDDTNALIFEYCQEHTNVKYIYQSNRGPGLAKNTGILAASGLFITFLDSDDEYMVNHLEFQRKVLISYPDTDFLHSKALIIGDPYVPDLYKPGKRIHLNECVIGGTFVVKKDAAIRIGGFPDLRFGDDTGFYQRAKENGLTIRKTEMRTYKYHRDSKDSLCNSEGRITD
jgi:glycosyltransferase involved in cell wall biosynthesis